MIWQKSFVMERERFDGADVLHLIRSSSAELDWHRLLERYGENWNLLFTYLLFFSFAYPSDVSLIPSDVLDELTRRHTALRSTPAEDRVCRGTLVSRAQYLIDVGQYGYADARISPRGNMSPEDAVYWTWAIDHVK